MKLYQGTAKCLWKMQLGGMYSFHEALRNALCEAMAVIL